MTEGNWDPEPANREYFRDVISGQRGWKVRREGRDRIRLESFKEDITKPFTLSEWVPENEDRKMTGAQIAQVCFDADKKLCAFLGLHDNATKIWVNLHEEKRREWIQHGPKSGIRGKLSRAIREALAELMG